MDVFFKTEALLLRLWNSVYWTNIFPYLPQSRADQQWVSHRFLPEVWLWDHWNKKELLQEDRASRRPCVAEEPSQPVCAAKRRASKGWVGAQRSRRAQMWLPLQKRNCDKGPQGQHVQHFVQRTRKDKSKFTVQKKNAAFILQKGSPLIVLHILFYPLLHIVDWFKKENQNKVFSFQKCSYH